jgi:hypothetical protein
MAEPENHTLRLLREFREESQQFQSRTDGTLSKLVTDVSDIRDKLDTLTRAVAGEIVQSRYVSAGVDERISDIERRLTALEQSR